MHVWCPPLPEAAASNGVTVHPTLGRISRRDLRAVDLLLDRFPPPRRLLVQWVPHGFGYRSMNVGFCLWLRQRARRGDRVEIMVHEPYLAFGGGALRWTAAASVHRVMTVILARAACRIWIAIPDWERRWRPYALGRDVPFAWLPIPSSLAEPAPDDVRRVRDRYARGGRSDRGPSGLVRKRRDARVVGEPARDPGAVAELRRRCCSVRTVDGFLSAARSRSSAARLADARDRSRSPPRRSLSTCGACDLLVQPYPDGISSRRTSAMAGLALGVPVVTTTGHLTEPLWAETRRASRS